MQNPIFKSVLAVVLGFGTFVVFFMVIEGIGAVLHPWPKDFQGTFEEVENQVATYPAWVLALLGGVGYGAMMFACTFVATRVGHQRNPWHGYGIGLLLFAIIVLNMTKLPFPGWYWVLMFVVLPPAVYFGTMVGRGSEKNPKENSSSDASG